MLGSTVCEEKPTTSAEKVEGTIFLPTPEGSRACTVCGRVVFASHHLPPCDTGPASRGPAQGPLCWVRGAQALHGPPQNSPDGRSRQSFRNPALRSRAPAPGCAPAWGSLPWNAFISTGPCCLRARIDALNQWSPTFLAPETGAPVRIEFMPAGLRRS